jgi:murein DD-endopeptidase MepM/ murein hydrolase activator NlpD
LDQQPPPFDPRALSLRRQSARRHAQSRHWRFYRTRSEWSAIENFARAPIQWGAERTILALLAVTVAFLSFVVAPGWASVAREGAGSRAAATVPIPVALPDVPAAIARAPTGDSDAWSTRRVVRGQTLGSLFAAEGLPAALLHRILDASRHREALTRIRPGQEFGFQRRPDGSLAAFRFDPSDGKRVVVHIDGTSLREEVEQRVLQRRVATASGRIEHSLFGAGDAAGLSDATIMQMANVFGYDVDFAQDLRRGDEFTVIYEQVYLDGEHLRDGAILGATFVNGGRRHVAIRFELGDGRYDYFDLEGRSLRKAFLRTPVEFSRISSRFSAGRMHPVLGRMRAHRGVDYAAPTGTPVRAAGDGKIVFRGWQHGYGNVVIVEHGGRYTTLYAHLSRFASDLRVGSRVRQGQTIGHVGMTGLATGPHLHYEFRVNGSHRDPLTVTLPKAEPLAGADLQRFRSASASMLAQLELLASRGAVAAR